MSMGFLLLLLFGSVLLCFVLVTGGKIHLQSEGYLPVIEHGTEAETWRKWHLCVIIKPWYLFHGSS